MTTSQVALSLRLFGPPTLSQDGKDIALPTDRRHQLLAYLAYRGTWVSRESLAELFWSGTSESVRSNLRRLLGRIQELAWLTDLEIERGRVRWSVPTDVAAFQRALSAQHLGDALGHYSGPLLENFEGYDDTAFVTWLEVERELVHSEWRETLLEQVDAYTHEQALERATHLLLTLLQHDPFDEEGLQLYLRVAAWDGLQRRALNTYHTFAARLERELGVKPSSVTLELVEKLTKSLADRPSRTQRAPEPHAAPASPAPAPDNALPLSATSFVGRDLELAEVANTLSRSGCRLLSILGPGGVGKTRLALQAATELQPAYGDGVAFVTLETLTDPGLLLFRIAEALGVSLTTGDDPLLQIVEVMRDKHLLLVLDTFEHLTNEGGKLSALLEGCPRMKLLVTSRERLQLAEEYTLLLGGLALPEAGENLLEAETFDGVQLFLERAKKVLSSFTLSETDLPDILRICRLVEGLPLGIELAAAWVRALPCAEIASEIAANLNFLASSARNGRERHRSIRAALTYSWSLLSEHEQDALANLAVFHGGFTRDAAAYVANTNIALLSALLDKSLLRVQGGRYSFHLLVHTFAQEKLVEARHLRETRHASYFMTRAQQPPTDPSLAYVRAERENLTAAWLRSAQTGLTREVKLAAPLLLNFFEMSGQYLDGKVLLERLLSHLAPTPTDGTDGTDGAYGTLLVCHGKLLYRLGDTEGAERQVTLGLKSLRPLGESWGIITGLNTLGNLAKLRTRTAEALAYYHEALELAQQEGHTRSIGGLLVNIGTVEVLLGDLGAARAHYERGLAFDRQAGNLWAVSIDLLNLGNLLYNMDELEAAEGYLREGVQIAEGQGSTHALTVLQLNLGAVAFKLAHYDEAQAHYDRALELAQEIGAKSTEAGAQVALGRLALVRGDKSAAQHTLTAGLKLAQALEDTSEILGALVGLAELAAPERPQAALTVLYLVTNHEGGMPDTKTWARGLLHELSTTAPAEVQERAKTQSRLYSLEEAAALILYQP